MLDAADTSLMANYWKGELKKAQDKLSDAESRLDKALADLRAARKSRKSKEYNAAVLKAERDRIKKLADTAKKVVDDAKDKMDAKADEMDVKMGEEVKEEAAYQKAAAAHKAYEAGYNNQENGSDPQGEI